MASTLYEMQPASFRIWSQVTVTITFGDNCYTTSTSEVQIWFTTEKSLVDHDIFK